jgi:hypothetical protein
MKDGLGRQDSNLGMAESKSEKFAVTRTAKDLQG